MRLPSLMGLGFDTPYIVSGWMLVALVILPFLFGLLYGLHVASKRFLLRLVRDARSEKLEELLGGKKEDGDKGPFTTSP
jgi:hypothetical protein